MCPMDEFRWERGVKVQERVTVQSASGREAGLRQTCSPGLSLCHPCGKLGSCFLFEGRAHFSGEGFVEECEQHLPCALLTPDYISSTERETRRRGLRLSILPYVKLKKKPSEVQTQACESQPVHSTSCSPHSSPEGASQSKNINLPIFPQTRARLC